MEKIITTVLLLIAATVSVLLIFNVVYPAVGRSGAAVSSMADSISDRVLSQIEIIHASGELDSDGVFQDTNSDGYFNVFVWVKNVGSSRLLAVGECDVFFGEQGDFDRVPYVNDAGGSLPSWTWSIENDDEWGPTATAKMTIYFSSPLTSGSYMLKVISPNGIPDETVLSM